MSVCQDNFDLDAAQTVCKELGCGSAIRVYNMSSVTNATKKLSFCLDKTTLFRECGQPASCGQHSEDAAVECSGKIIVSGPNIYHDGLCKVLMTST